MRTSKETFVYMENYYSFLSRSVTSKGYTWPISFYFKHRSLPVAVSDIVAISSSTCFSLTVTNIWYHLPFLTSNRGVFFDKIP